MNDDLEDLLAETAALDAHLENRVEVWRIVIDENGQPTGQRIYRGSFSAPVGWEPPSMEDLLARAKGSRE